MKKLSQTYQAPLSTGFPRQEYWSGLPFPSPMRACMRSRFSCVRLCATCGQQPTRLLCIQDSPGKDTGVGCHVLLPFGVKSQEYMMREERKAGGPVEDPLQGGTESWELWLQPQVHDKSISIWTRQWSSELSGPFWIRVMLGTNLKSIPYPHGHTPSIVAVHSVMSDSLRPHRLQHARLPCSLLSPGVCSNSCPLSQSCHPTI